ncbi:MAG: hypothetical protein RIR11_2725 [Bacteroidota bacterium]
MSTTNFNQPTTPAPYGSGNNNNDGQKRLLTIAGIAIALLLGTTIWLAVGKYKTGQELESLEMNFEQQKTALADVESKYNTAVAELEQQKGINAELDAKINEQVNQLTAQKGQIDQLIRDKKDYRSSLNNMQAKQKEYLAEIDNLKAQVGILTESNTRLTGEKEQLSTNLAQTQGELQATTQAKAELISAKTQLESEKTVLSKKVDRGSAIDITKFDIKTLAVSSGGKEKEKAKAKKVDKVNICFTTEANEVTEAGEETFHVIVVDPKGTPLLNDALGSGVAADKKASSDFRFTTTATTNYQNNEANVCASWLPGEKWIAGQYQVKVYNKGYLVGQSTFNLKKGIF